MLDQDREEELEALEQYRKGLQPAPILYRADGIKVNTKPGELMTFIASDESEDRLGDVITASGWQLENFQKNPVFLYMHNPFIPPIGTWQKIWVEQNQLLASPHWDEGDDFAQLIKGKYERGIMRAISVGFRAHEFEEVPNKEMGKDSKLIFKKQELLEISAVAVPAHSKTLKRALENRKYFWIPFQMGAKENIAEIRKELVLLRDEVNEALDESVFKEEESEQFDWDEVLMEISNLTHTQGGSHE